MSSKTPSIVKMQVIPLAGQDSMLLTLSGAHAPFFTRNLVVLTDNSGHTGVGEIHGGTYTQAQLESFIPLVAGREIGAYRSVIGELEKISSAPHGDGGEGLQRLNISNLKYVVHAEAAVEMAFLDLLGQYMELPVCQLLAKGKQRDHIPVLGYLFYVGDKGRVPELPYRNAANSDDAWFRLRDTEMLTAEALVQQAEILTEKYGFRSFKLKGGVLSCDEEMETVAAIKRRFPEHDVHIDPNGAWSLQQAIDICGKNRWALHYIEDPVSAENGFSSREIHAEFKAATGIPVATNMFAVDFRQLYHSLMERSVDIVLADPHFWTMNGSLRVAQDLNDQGLTWGIHSNNHFDVTLAAFIQCAAAAPGSIAAIDTHYIWQDGQALTIDPPVIQNGLLTVPDRPGLGVTLDQRAVEKAHDLYRKLPPRYRDRNDSYVMQRLIPGWYFDPKRPCLLPRVR